MLTTADFIVIAFYALLMGWIGLIAQRKSIDVDDYFAAGHNLPWWMAAISHHVSGYSAVVFVGFAGRAVAAGFSMWTLFSLSCFIALMVGCVAWVPRWSRLRVLTPVEYLEARYNNAVRTLVALSGIAVKFIDLGIKLYAISVVIHVVTNWPVLPIALITGIITIVYILVQFTDNFALYTGGEILVALILYFGEGLICKRPPEKEREVEALFARLNAD